MSPQPMEKNVLAETAFMYALMCVYAASMTILGPVLLLIVGEFALPLSQGGVFMAWQNIGGFFGIALSGIFIDRLPKRLSIVVSFFLCSFLLVVLNFASSFAVFLVLMALIGLASRVSDVTLNAGISEIHARNRGFYLGLLHCAFAVGAFLGPIYAGCMVEHFASWRPPYMALGLAGIAVVGAYCFVVRGKSRFAAAGTAEKPPPEPVRQLLTRRMLFAALIMLCYSGHQAGLNNWLPAYLSTDIGLDDMAAGFGVSAFWIGLILGRFAGSLLTRLISERTLLLYGNALGGLFLLAGAVSGTAAMAFAGSFSAGLFAGAATPMMLTLAYSWHPQSQGRVTTLLFLAIAVGGVFVPWFMGVIAGWGGLDIAMMFNAAVLLSAAALVLPIPKQERFRAGE